MTEAWMCSAFQNDPACYDEGAVFYDFYTRKAYPGGQTIEIPVTLSSIPLYIRSGGLVAMAGNKLDNLATQKAEFMILLCAADADGSFTLYEDDGVSLNYEKGKYLKTYIHMSAGEKTFLDFEQEGEFETAVRSMYVDMGS